MIAERKFCTACATKYGKQLWAGSCVCTGSVELAWKCEPLEEEPKKPKTFMERISVGSNLGWGPFAGVTRWNLCCDGTPMGNMFNFYPTGKLRNPFPIKGEATLHGWATEEEARKAFDKMKAHVQEVLSLPRQDREGASRLWT